MTYAQAHQRAANETRYGDQIGDAFDLQNLNWLQQDQRNRPNTATELAAFSPKLQKMVVEMVQQNRLNKLEDQDIFIKQ